MTSPDNAPARGEQPSRPSWEYEVTARIIKTIAGTDSNTVEEAARMQTDALVGYLNSYREPGREPLRRPLVGVTDYPAAQRVLGVVKSQPDTMGHLGVTPEFLDQLTHEVTTASRQEQVVYSSSSPQVGRRLRSGASRRV